MKNKFISKRYWKDKSTAMSAAADAARQHDNIIDLSIGDPDMITDDIIIDNAFRDAKLGYTKYTESRGDRELRDEIAKFYKEEYNMDIADEEIFVSTSGCIAMFLILQAILDDGDEVILQGPYFTPYKQQIELAGGIPVELVTTEEMDFQIDINTLEKSINERTKAIIINSPCNPTGNVLSMDSLKDIANIAKKYDLLVIADDIYTSFSYASKFVPISSLPDMKERTITINSFSKNYIMTGWRIGNIIAPRDIISVIQIINENIVYSAPSISQRAAIYAIRNRDKIQPKVIEEYKKRVFYAADRINNIPKLSVLPPKGTFYLFMNIKETKLSSAEFCDRLVNEAQVMAIPGSAFGKSGEGFVRLACTVDEDKLKEAFDRIEKIKF